MAREKFIALRQEEYDGLMQLLAERFSGGLKQTAQRGQAPREDVGFTFTCKNVSGDEIPARSVVRVTDGEHADDRKRWEIDLVTAADESFYVVTGPQAIPADKSRQCSVWGELEITFDDSGDDPEYGETWGPKDGETMLFKHYPGFTATGVVHPDGWATFIQDFNHSFRGKTNSSVSIGGTVAVSLHRAGVDTTIDISGVASPYGAVDSGKWVKVNVVDGVREIEVAECG